MAVNPFELSDALDSMTILVDTREQPTAQSQRRYNAFGCPYERHKLSYGDYSAKFLLPDGSWLSLEEIAVVERKMNWDELCMCFCKERDRFMREFERIKEAKAKCYLLIEGANFENAYAGRYRSKMHPNALIANLFMLCAEFGAVPIFCKAETSGKVIHDCLYREGKKKLMEVLDDDL